MGRDTKWLIGSYRYPIDPFRFQWPWVTWNAGREGSNFSGWSPFLCSCHVNNRHQIQHVGNMCFIGQPCPHSKRAWPSAAWIKTIVNWVTVTRNSAIADKPRNAFRGKSRSPNMVPFHMLGMVSYCAIVTLSLRRAVFTIFDYKECLDLEMGVKGHSRSLSVVSFDRLCMVSY